MEKIKEQFWRKLWEVAWAMKFPAITATAGFILQDPTWQTCLKWVAVGMAIGFGSRFVRSWWDRDTGERMYSDISFAVNEMNSLLVNNSDPEKRIAVTWWLGINCFVSDFLSKPSATTGRNIAKNIESVLRETLLNETEKIIANKICERLKDVLRK